MEIDTSQTDGYWFFLSYSSQDNDEYLRRFWADLAQELRMAATIPASLGIEKIGFRDKKEIYPGEDWRKSLSKALQTSKILLCLYSRPYFVSEYCGKEFNVFLNRVTAYTSKLKEGAEQPRLIIPVLWGMPNRFIDLLPQMIKDIQYKFEDFGDLYSQQGLHYLMRVKDEGNESAYLKFVIKLADMIARQAQAHQMEQTVRFPSIDEVSSTFHMQAPVSFNASLQPPAELPKATPIPAVKGPEVAWFVYVAGRETDYDNIRKVRDGYGKQGGFDWKPYYPTKEKIGVIAASVASKNSFTPEVLPLSQDLIEHLRQAEKNNTPVILILDPWTMKLASYAKPMSDLDMQRLTTSVVLVVWNKGDEETNQQGQALRAVLQQTFPRSLGSKDVLRDSISSEKELKREISAVLKALRNKIMQNPNPILPVETTPGSFPTLKVPEPVNPAGEALASNTTSGDEMSAASPTREDI